MTRNNLSYIGLLLSAMFATACSDDIVDGGGTLSGDGKKTPIEVTALLDAGGATTRAVDMDFANGDELIAYLRHVTATKTTTDDKVTFSDITSVTADHAPKLVTFLAGVMSTYNGGDIAPVGLANKENENDRSLGLTSSNTKQTINLMAKDGSNSIPIYWDDFSNSVSGGTDLRTEGHYLQSYYGYCYNGGTPTTALVEGTGVLGWSVATDQTASDKSAFQHSDLLWSAEQTPIKYAHVDVQGNREHGTLILPYTHAMSKVTIKVIVADGFASDYKFNGVTTKLHSMYSTCKCTAPTYTIEERGTSADITMWQGSIETAKKCTYEAIVVPSILSVVNPFATISGLDGNDYVIPITDAMLQKGSEHSNKGWGDQLTETEENIQSGTAQSRPHVPTDGQNANTTSTIPKGKGFMMKSGVNYVLNVTISKQQITVSALIKDWQNVEADGEARVQFTSDVNGKGSIVEELRTGGFKVYKNSDNTAFGAQGFDVNSPVTSLTWDQTNSIWQYSPVIYWAGQQDASYFRALSPKDATLSMTQTNDVLWGFACDDVANNRDKVGETNEVKITPRTGDVPLVFEHVMSKITVNLKTAEGDHTSATSSAVDLTGAKIEISNLYQDGTLEMVKGNISTDGKTKAVDAISADKTGTTDVPKVEGLPVIPQTIADESILKITLKDGTVYKLKLNTCVDSESTADPKPAITAWQRGKHYTYTINVEKEAITFRAMIKAWDEKEGSGNATLEWD